MKRVIPILTALALLAAAPPVAASARCDSSCQQAKKLKRQVRTYKRKAATYKRQAATYKRQAASEKASVSALKTQVAGLNTQVATLGGEVASLHTPGALPGLIGAVASTTDFKTYVLDPAAARWRTLALGNECAEYQQEGSSWLYQFWSPDLC
ncbi:MAG TPA: hypothetical protein VFN82_05290 [Solirubrobacterales bacterium]|jgi:hypothetical protein|nr:hypothetical protein [Solirubrobacterales bacterium]